MVQVMPPDLTPYHYVILATVNSLHRDIYPLPRLDCEIDFFLIYGVEKKGQGRIFYTSARGVLATASAPVVSRPSRCLSPQLRAKTRDPAPLASDRYRTLDAARPAKT
jgi:hypothetical protein